MKYILAIFICIGMSANAQVSIKIDAAAEKKAIFHTYMEETIRLPQTQERYWTLTGRC